MPSGGVSTRCSKADINLRRKAKRRQMPRGKLLLTESSRPTVNAHRCMDDLYLTLAYTASIRFLRILYCLFMEEKWHPVTSGSDHQMCETETRMTSQDMYSPRSAPATAYCKQPVHVDRSNRNAGGFRLTHYALRIHTRIFSRYPFI